MRIIYCYRTCSIEKDGIEQPVLLDHIAADPQLVDVINVGTFQFRYKLDPVTHTVEPDLLFNNLKLSDPMVQKMWSETKKVGNMGIDILLTLGGDRTFDILFQDFDTCYRQLVALIKAKYWITGIDLKIFGWVSYFDIAAFIKLIKRDFGANFKVTLTVPAYALQKPHKHLSNFRYDDLYEQLGKLISWYNVEAHWNYCYKTYNRIIKNGYRAADIVFCMDSELLGGMSSFKEIVKTVRQIKVKYPDMCAVAVSDYYNAPPGPTPIRWAELMFYLVK